MPPGSLRLSAVLGLHPCPSFAFTSPLISYTPMLSHLCDAMLKSRCRRLVLRCLTPLHARVIGGGSRATSSGRRPVTTHTHPRGSRLRPSVLRKMRLKASLADKEAARAKWRFFLLRCPSSLNPNLVILPFVETATQGDISPLAESLESPFRRICPESSLHPTSSSSAVPDRSWIIPLEVHEQQVRLATCLFVTLTKRV